MCQLRAVFRPGSRRRILCSSSPPGSFLVKNNVMICWFSSWSMKKHHILLYFHFPCMFSEYQNQRWDHGAPFWSHCYGWMHQHFWHGMALSNVLTNMKQGWIIQNLNVLKVVEKDGWGGGAYGTLFFFFLNRGHVSGLTETHRHDCPIIAYHEISWQSVKS